MEKTEEPGQKRPPIMVKTPKAVIQARVGMIAEMIIKGLSQREIWTYVSEKESWGVTQRTIRRYRIKAIAEIKIHTQRTIAEKAAIAEQRLEYLFARTVAIQDYKGALAVQREINELHGFKTHKIEIIPPDARLTKEELAERIREMEEEFKKRGIIITAPGTLLDTNTE